MDEQESKGGTKKTRKTVGKREDVVVLSYLGTSLASRSNKTLRSGVSVLAVVPRISTGTLVRINIIVI